MSDNDKVDALLEALHKYAMDVDPELGLPLLHSHFDDMRSIVAEHFQRWAGERQQPVLGRQICDCVRDGNGWMVNCGKQPEDRICRLVHQPCEHCHLTSPEPKPAQEDTFLLDVLRCAEEALLQHNGNAQVIGKVRLAMSLRGTR